VGKAVWEKQCEKSSVGWRFDFPDSEKLDPGSEGKGFWDKGDGDPRLAQSPTRSPEN